MDPNEIKDWYKVRISFRSKCLECNREILPGQVLWSNSTKAAKHLACNNVDRMDLSQMEKQTSSTSNSSFVSNKLQVIELKCFICGNKTGCNVCEHLTSCEQRMVSKYCICKGCSEQEESFGNYEQSFLVKGSKYLK